MTTLSTKAIVDASQEAIHSDTVTQIPTTSDSSTSELLRMEVEILRSELEVARLDLLLADDEVERLKQSAMTMNLKDLSFEDSNDMVEVSSLKAQVKALTAQLESNEDEKIALEDEITCLKGLRALDRELLDVCRVLVQEMGQDMATQGSRLDELNGLLQTKQNQLKKSEMTIHLLKQRNLELEQLNAEMGVNIQSTDDSKSRKNNQAQLEEGVIENVMLQMAQEKGYLNANVDVEVRCAEVRQEMESKYKSLLESQQMELKKAQEAATAGQHELLVMRETVSALKNEKDSVMRQMLESEQMQSSAHSLKEANEILHKQSQHYVAEVELLKQEIHKLTKLQQQQQEIKKQEQASLIVNGNGGVTNVSHGTNVSKTHSYSEGTETEQDVRSLRALVERLQSDLNVVRQKDFIETFTVKEKLSQLRKKTNDQRQNLLREWSRTKRHVLFEKARMCVVDLSASGQKDKPQEWKKSLETVLETFQKQVESNINKQSQQSQQSEQNKVEDHNNNFSNVDELYNTWLDTFNTTAAAIHRVKNINHSAPPSVDQQVVAKVHVQLPPSATKASQILTQLQSMRNAHQSTDGQRMTDANVLRVTKRSLQSFNLPTLNAM